MKATLHQSIRTTLLATALAAWTALGAHAQVPAVPAGQDSSVTFHVSTLGLGAEYGKQIGSHFAGRLGFNNYSLSRSATYQDVDYNAHLRLSSVSGLGDFYPTEKSSFHVTAGLVINSNRVSGTGRPNGNQTFTFNGHTYTVSEVGSLNGRATFSKVAPYFGIGFGRPGGGGPPLRLLLDIGVLVQGKADLSLVATGAAADPALAADVQTQRDRIQSDLNKFKLYPVVSVGLAYHF